MRTPGLNFLLRRRKFSLPLLSLSFLGGMMILEAAPSESEVKAAFLYNFTKYVDWPDSAFSSPNDSLVIGIYGEEDVETPLQTIISGKMIRHHPLVVKHVTNLETIPNCQVLYVDDSQKENLSAILSKAAKSPVLTVGETDSFMDKGGIINLTIRNGAVHLNVNLQAAQSVQLGISSKLLNIADSVK